MADACGPGAWPSRGRARYAQALLVTVAFFTAMDIYLISLLVEPIKQELALTDVEVGLANSSTLYLAYAVFCVPAGILVDRANRVRMLAGAILLWCLGLVLTGLSSGITLLAGSKLVLGLANAISLPAAMSLLADHFAPVRRAMATASYGIGQGMGQAGAIFVGGDPFPRGGARGFELFLQREQIVVDPDVVVRDRGARQHAGQLQQRGGRGGLSGRQRGAFHDAVDQLQRRVLRIVFFEPFADNPQSFEHVHGACSSVD